MEVVRITEFGGVHDGPEPGDVPLGGLWRADDVDVSDPRALRSRWGTADFLGTYVYSSAIRDAVLLNGDLLTVRVGNPMVADVLTGAGATLSLGNTLAAGAEASLVPWRSPTELLVFLVSGGQTPEQWDTTANLWTTPTATVDGVAGRAMPKMQDAVQSGIDQRLLGWTGANSGLYGPHGAQSYPWRVWASEPGLPKTWTTTRYFDLFPTAGTPSGVMNGVAWGGKVFFFTSKALFVLHSVSVTAGGAPVFNVYEVGGHGTHYYRHACAGERGVYYLNEKGLYVTDGGPGQLVSGALGRIFQGFQHPRLIGGEHSYSGIDIVRSVRAFGGLVFVNSDSAGADAARTWVYHEASGAWSTWSDVAMVVREYFGSGVATIALPRDNATLRPRTLTEGTPEVGLEIVLPIEPAGGELTTLRRVVVEGSFTSAPTVQVATDQQLVGSNVNWGSALVAQSAGGGGPGPARISYLARDRGRAFAVQIQSGESLAALTSIELEHEPSAPRHAKRGTYE
jgi:hypothetical protein